MTAIFKREFKAYFTSPLGYLVVGILALFEGLFFVFACAQGTAETEAIISSCTLIIMFVIPILTMRLFSEERKQKTDQLLLTAPVSLWGIALGKFFSAFAVYGLSFAPTVVYQIIFVAKVETLDWGKYLCALFGIALYGAALIAICLFISAITESQVIAAVISMAISLGLNMLDTLAGMTGSSFIIKAASHLLFLNRYTTFHNGIIDFSNIIFFVSIAFFFIFLTVRMLEKKRWA